jgi:hypothetical protein
VALVRTDVSEERSASIVRVTRICELGTLAVTSNRRTLRRNTNSLQSSMLLVTANVPRSPILVTLMKEALSSSETSVLTRATRRTSQKTPFFIVTAVETSNLTTFYVCCKCTILSPVRPSSLWPLYLPNVVLRLWRMNEVIPVFNYLRIAMKMYGEVEV